MASEAQQRAFDFDRFMRFVRIGARRGDCWEWRGNRPDGRHGHFSVGEKTEKAHRWIYERVIGPIPDNELLRHTCDNDWCVNLMHLVPGSSRDNAQDKIAAGHLPDRSGSKHPLARLTEESVLKIRAMAANGFKQKFIAARYGMSRQQIGKIVSRVNWDHV